MRAGGGSVQGACRSRVCAVSLQRAPNQEWATWLKTKSDGTSSTHNPPLFVVSVPQIWPTGRLPLPAAKPRTAVY